MIDPTHNVEQARLLINLNTNPSLFMKEMPTNKAGNYKIREFEFLDTFGFSGTLVHSVGGSEGDGEYVSRVLEIKLQGKSISFLEITGFYTSEDGTEYDKEWCRVFPLMLTELAYLNKEQFDKNRHNPVNRKVFIIDMEKLTAAECIGQIKLITEAIVTNGLK